MDSTKVIEKRPWNSLSAYCVFSNLETYTPKAQGCHFSGCVFKGSGTAIKLHFINCHFQACVFQELQLLNCEFTDCTFHYCKWDYCQFTQCDFYQNSGRGNFWNYNDFKIHELDEGLINEVDYEKNTISYNYSKNLLTPVC
jgi:uncharacterized protein YjbI with pentapeptide repeats